MVAGGSKVEVVGCWVVFGGGGGGGVWVVGFGFGGGGGGAAEPPKFHEPVSTPTDSGAKNWKSPSEKSRPPKGHPGHCTSSQECKLNKG